jgi:tetratricopeptide (TPR) repeat protein
MIHHTTNDPRIQAIENDLEQALVNAEQAGDLENALKHSWILEERLLALDIPSSGPLFQAQQRLLAAVFMRQANILRQFGRGEKAAAASICALEAARNAGDDLTLGRSLLFYGTTLIFSGDIEPGLEYLEEARQEFSRGESADHRQGLGRYWILRADLANALVMDGGAPEALEAAGQAIALLEPIANWPEAAHAWAARAIACEALGDPEGAESARQAQALAESRIPRGQKNGV